jgi:cystathionine beta-lyase/cystathionine gamma-synthase
MAEKPDDLCPRPDRLPPQPTQPLSAPLYLSAVYQCHDPQQAADLLAHRSPGYAYRRDGHPNADLLAEKCRQLHAAERAVITSSGMSALALALLSQLESGDHVVVSNQLYGRSLALFTAEARRMRIASTVVDPSDLAGTAAAFTANTRLVVAETITNPLLRVADLAALAELAQRRGARLLVDNTLAGPAICRPFALAADLVVESLTKAMNGHSDVLLGLLCGRAALWDRVPDALSIWGLTSAPFDCWLASRGLSTLALRMERASANALAIAQFLSGQRAIELVRYPGLPQHPDHELAKRQFGQRFGSMVTFTLGGGAKAAEAFIAAAAAAGIPFCPSLGEVSTTLAHPASTSHRALGEEARAALGIQAGTIRLSVGIESPEFILAALAKALHAH